LLTIDFQLSYQRLRKRIVLWKLSHQFCVWNVTTPVKSFKEYPNVRIVDNCTFRMKLQVF
jgi:hypothetical protein